MDIKNVRAELLSLYKRAEQFKNHKDSEHHCENSESLALKYREIMNAYHEVGNGKPIFDLAIGIVLKVKRESTLFQIVDGMLSSFGERHFIVVIDASHRYADKDVFGAIVLGCSSCIGALVHCNETISDAIERHSDEADEFLIQKFGFLPDVSDEDAVLIDKSLVEQRLENFHFSDVKSSPISALAKICYQLQRVNYFHPTHCHAAIFGEMLGDETFFVSKELIN